MALGTALNTAIGSALGHCWTIGPHWRARAGDLSSLQAHRASVPDPLYGHVNVSFLADLPRGAATAVVVVHGLGGSYASVYMQRALVAARELGIGCVLTGMRGSDGTGEDLYHAGLWQDVAAVCDSAPLRSYASIVVLGYSLGGHIALCGAVDGFSDRVRAVAAVCSPLDLNRSVEAIDSPLRWPYRSYILRALRQTYRAIAERRQLRQDEQTLRSIATIRQWDDAFVAPRFGFSSASDYYARVSVGRQLHRLSRPALYVGADWDPMVPKHTVLESLSRDAEYLTTKWLARAGHLGFPLDCDLGFGAELGLERQVLRWLMRSV